MSDRKVVIKDLVDDNNLKVYSGEDFLSEKSVSVDDISRPGIEMTGYFDYYPNNRVQLFGQTETAYAKTLDNDRQNYIYGNLATDETPVFVISRGIQPNENLKNAATKHKVPVVGSDLATTRLSSVLTEYLTDKLAERESIHGVLVDIYGIGVLITGQSGVGKSETALELVNRGHRLIADDRVEVYQKDEKTIVGEAPKILSHLLEIRGVGIIDVMTLYGVGAVRSEANIDLVINLEEWKDDNEYDRLGSGTQTQKFFAVEVPKITVPVKVGRNLSIIIESAAMNFRAKKMGYDATEKFENNLDGLIDENSKKDMNDK